MTASAAKHRPLWLCALGRRPLPGELAVAGARYGLAQVYKNDFFAVTARYDRVSAEAEAGAPGSVVLKMNRQAPALIPLRFVGRVLAWREAGAFERVGILPGIPRFLGRFEDTGVIHEFVPGHAMRKGERVSDDFHDRLHELIAGIHARNVAYVDLEKCENVIVGDDGRPYLVDFQIAFYWPWRFGGRSFPVRWLLRRFQSADRYHLVKLHRRTRRDQLSPEALAASYRRPWYVRLHGLLMRPLTLLRRRILDRLDPRRGEGERGRVDADGSTLRAGGADRTGAA
ncbi:MAG: hypothetical protein BroJett001_33570 [Chloroflexota bacterium]|nr:MAG: hypothetical protein BroJett001_33570 [Chloroflexota bacterium]